MINRMRYLRVSLLKACNFNCFYCRPPSIDDYTAKDFTDPDKFKHSIRLLLQMGVGKVRFTGGEPTLYRPLPELISYTKSLDHEIKVAITTNGRTLKTQAKVLAEAGLDSVNISLDTLQADKFKQITGVGCFDRVIEGIEAACENFSDVKINVVVINGVNDHEINDLVTFANSLGVDIRFIEYMQTKYSADRDRGYLSAAESIKRVEHELYSVTDDISSPARYYTADDLAIRVGFINSVSQPFCSHCNRIRLTSDGNLYTCLFSSRAINLFDLLDNGYAEASRAINKFVAGKVFVGSETAARAKAYLPAFSEIGG